ncbi:MAG: hypothetical protein ACYTGG_04090 [Planctomycetota bacterium]|jgi:hypothetical protein
MSSEEAPVDPDLLQAFLASHDAACPVCSYNLRGVAGSKCPECGHGLALAVRQPRRLGRRFGLLVLLFAWLLLAGSMNSYRSWREIDRTAQGWGKVTWMGMSAPAPPSAPQPAPAGGTIPADINEVVEVDLDTAAAPLVPPLDLGGVTTLALPSGLATLEASRISLDTTGPIVASGQSRLRVLAQRGPGRQFANVTLAQWATASWWMALAATSAAAMLVLVVYRSQLSSRMTSVLLVTAWVSFGGYFAYHGVTFLGEVL